jgi:hypothetical protein
MYVVYIYELRKIKIPLNFNCRLEFGAGQETNSGERVIGQPAFTGAERTAVAG